MLKRLAVTILAVYVVMVILVVIKADPWTIGGKINSSLQR